MEDDFPAATRFKRYAQVGGTLTKVATRMAGNKLLGRETDHARQSQEMSAVMGALKGPLMKVAQFLSTVPDALPEDYTQAFAQLQSQAPPMGWAFVKRRAQAELGSDWLSHFEYFERDASAAASLGQVHKARLKDGRIVACKLQYPHMAATMEADLSQLKMGLKLYEATLGALETQNILVEIAQHLRQELDYTREACHMALFAKIFEKDPAIQVPTCITDLSTKQLLTMTWLDGAPITSLKDASQDERNHLARTLFRAWYAPLYGYGVLHGDPHLGNYTVDGARINLLDFGCVRIFSPSFLKSTLDLREAIRTSCKDTARKAYAAWGFGDLSDELVHALNLWAEMLYEPLIDNRVRPIQEGNSGTHGRERAAHVHATLRKLGGVRPPREFVFLDRAAVGIGSAFMRLGAEVNWCALFEDLVQDFSVEGVAAAQKELLRSVPCEL